MSQNKVNRNLVITKAVENICDDCKKCEVAAIKVDTGEKVKVQARYCLNGSGYIYIDLYDADGGYLESCKLKHLTDSCSLPYDLKIDSEPDCGCI